MMSQVDELGASDGPALVFYTTEGCHLCEYAAEMLDHLIKQQGITVQAVDISESEELVELYGIRIPVIKCLRSNEELGWPFTIEQLANLI